MSIVTYIDAEGTSTEVVQEAGENLMSLAVNNLVEGVVGECGGAMACATCHCYVDTKYTHLFSDIGELEEAMLEMLPERRPTSRLSCQLELTEDTPDIEVHLPDNQEF